MHARLDPELGLLRWRLLRRPGADNDTYELLNLQPPLRDHTVKDIQANGKTRQNAFAAVTQSLKDYIPELAAVRPYAPDALGWMDDFSHSGIYDALGGASRAAPYVNLFAPVNGVLKPLLEPAAQSQAFKDATSLDQRWRCPGSIERGATFKPSADFPCDASEGPLGP